MRHLMFRRIVMLFLIALSAWGLARPAFAQTSAQWDVRYDALVADAKAQMFGDPLIAIDRARAAEGMAAHLTVARRNTAVATAQWLQGEAYLRLNDTARAEPLIERALALVAKPAQPTKLYGDLLLSRGGLRLAEADVAGALASYQQAHNIFRDIGEARSRAIAIVSIGFLYQEAGDFKSALRYFDQSADIYKGDQRLLFSIYTNRGICLMDFNKIAQAQTAFRKALALAHDLKTPTLEASTLRNIARAQLFAGQRAAAERSIALGLQAERGVDAAASRNHFLVLSAWAARLRGNLPEAQRLIERAFANVDPNASTLDMREGHLVAYDIYKETHNQAKALVHLEALKQVDDKTSKLAASANTALAAARFDFANQELKIEKLKRAQLLRNIEDARNRARTQQTIFGGLAVATVIIVSMLAFGLITIRRSRNEVRAANVDLAKTNEALGRALAAKTEFLATTSHEIRTPLNGILGMTQVMLADRSLEEPLRDRIGVVHSAGVTMRALVDDILDVAKMETGNLTIEQVPFDLKAMLRDVSRMWEEQARGKGLGFVLDLETCPDFIEGDPARMRQIAFNLLSNALKFTERGQITVRAFSEGSALRISVNDTGIGIPHDKIGIIFESFRQVDAGTTRKYGGTGLGLAICQNLARAMGGDVTVQSVVGTGTTFTLSLPLALAPAPTVTMASAEATPDALLILDRNPISRSMLRAVLEARAGVVLFAGSVDEAVARIVQGGVTRVLIDDATAQAESDVDAGLAALGASDAITTLLWRAPSAEDCARFAAMGIDRVIAKPIAGAALAAAMFGNAVPAAKSASEVLVTQAA
ncbi:tetratricopeptide repeat-containing hybrid sensor histidine kinase/response regulator [Sphingomonas echinoides]|uniref:histidine kinase n=1 Tax=Sphingomonas echinoides TaxID=59803 RepID=A0ABU4PPC4_9SPHN|nr:ATP-binding protein [Sphingomonas echinoides]MDX5984644.1 ATP-binding protein [Sphingomonas echinoides]